MSNESEFEDRENRSFVHVNGESIPVSSVKVIDVAEDIQGRDEYTFIYKGKTYTSLVTCCR